MKQTPVHLLPASKYDVEKAQELIDRGWPAVEPVISSILEWLQDLNWPVAKVFQPFAVSVGAPLAPAVRQVLLGSDSGWKYSLLVGVVALSQELELALIPELECLATRPSSSDQAEGLQELALEILQHLDMG